MNDFETDLGYSQKASEAGFWEAVYRKAFPDFSCFMENDNNNEAQRRGVDRVILLNNGKTIYIDEKKRRKVYPDIILEYLSVDNTNAPGWIEKDLAIDYLAYAFMPIKTCYLFDWLILRRAWLHYGSKWKEKYDKIPAKNVGYTTWSVAVPIEVLRNAIQTARVITV